MATPDPRSTTTVRELLFGVPMLAPPLGVFDPATAPDAPFPLFLDWLRQAVAERVSEPHAMTLATVDRDGCPDLRVVALRDAGPDGWSFATGAGSAKGRQLAARPLAALGFHWREQGRQIRLRGPVVRADPETAAADFRSRLPGSRAASLVGRQSEPLADSALLAPAFAEALDRATADPSLVDPEHALFTVRPTAVEFWQGAPGRGHTRLRYTADADGGWTRGLLWP
ncbi:pyridoxine/pyridoxamine 5'-phosphate oxidase [Streptacidiphilus cavernicola]|uniref:Pyridoxal 5'-phosphate synthase n=1 Tax=Streptacidiphilus cavernicola TaxID=3342716 RepID=A0ABV6W667_9ACTN